MRRMLIPFLLMATVFSVVCQSALAAPTDTIQTDKIITIPSFDGIELVGRLRLPDGDKISRSPFM